MKAINFSAAVENIPKQWSKVDLRSWYILNIVLLLDCTPSVIALKLGTFQSSLATLHSLPLIVIACLDDDAFVRALTTMSTNNIDSNNNCEEKAELCGVSDAEVSDQIAEICASCGIAEVDNVKLKKCACNLVKYCSEECQKEHRPMHKRACKKRLAELRDKILFTQPDSCCYGECPICFLPMPIDLTKSCFCSCCSKTICKGCDYANDMMSSGSGNCPFCREPFPDDDEDIRFRKMKRIEAGDPAAMSEMGTYCRNEGDYESAFEYFTKAAELGFVEAHYHLGVVYERGRGVKKVKDKEVYHWEKAAIGGHPGARFILGCIEGENRRYERSVKHMVIAAKLGVEESIKALWTHYFDGNITKDDLEATLRAHQAAVDATKSPQRDAAAAAGQER